MAGAFFETNAIAAPATLIAANVGDQIQGQQMKFVYAQGSDPIHIKLKTANKMPRKLIKPTTRVASLSAKHSVIRLELKPRKMRLGLRKQ